MEKQKKDEKTTNDNEKKSLKKEIVKGEKIINASSEGGNKNEV